MVCNKAFCPDKPRLLLFSDDTANVDVTGTIGKGTDTANPLRISNTPEQLS